MMYMFLFIIVAQLIKIFEVEITVNAGSLLQIINKIIAIEIFNLDIKIILHKKVCVSVRITVNLFNTIKPSVTLIIDQITFFKVPAHYT